MMTPGVVQIPGDVSVSQAALLMHKEQVPCLLVKDTETRFGIVTPIDIVAKVVAQGLEPHNVEARSIMSKSVRSIEYDQALEDATALMATTGAPLLIVTKQNQPVGILTAGDLVFAPKRCDTHIPANVQALNRATPAAVQPVTIIQLSEVGALVEGHTVLRPRTAVSLTFSLPGCNASLSVHGIVLSAHDPVAKTADSEHSSQGMDIQFTDLPASERSRIRAWVRQVRSTSSGTQ